MTQKWKSGVIFSHSKHNIKPETQISKSIENAKAGVCVILKRSSLPVYENDFNQVKRCTDVLFWIARVHKEDYPISQNVAW